MTAARFSIIWQPYKDASPTGRKLPRTVAFPFFVDGSLHADLSAGEPVRLDARGLMLGILVAYDDPSPFAEVADVHQLAATASDLVSELAAPTLEIALLDGAAYLREHHGLGPSRVALTTATKLSPASSMIRCDLIATCWALLSSADKNERQFLLRQIASAYRPADLDIVDPGAVQQLLYATLVALHFLPDSEDSLRTLLASESVRRITDKWYVDRIRALLSTPASSLDDLL